VPIDERQMSLIASRLTQRVGKAVQVEARVDPSIMGGVVAQIGDDVFDGSVRGRLERLRRSLIA
jgi:F-type H+-transporting ATPase subunit delta